MAIVSACVALAVIAWEPLSFYIYSRPATPEELREFFDVDPYGGDGIIAFEGRIERFEEDVVPIGRGVVKMGVWRASYNDSDVCAVEEYYSSEGIGEGATVWLPNGKVWFQAFVTSVDDWEVEYLHDPPWRREVEDQPFSTGKLRDVSFGWEVEDFDLPKRLPLPLEFFRGADLSTSSLQELDLSGFDFTDANLRDTCLAGSDLRDVRGLTADQLEGAYLKGAQLSEDLLQQVGEERVRKKEIDGG